MYAFTNYLVGMLLEFEEANELVLEIRVTILSLHFLLFRLIMQVMPWLPLLLIHLFLFLFNTV